MCWRELPMRPNRRLTESDPRELTDGELLELVLSYALPERQARGAAMELRSRYRNAAGVLSAPKRDRDSAVGRDGRGGLLLEVLRQMSLRAEDQRRREARADTSLEAGKLLLPRFTGQSTETVRVLYLDGELRVLACETLCQGLESAVRVDIYRLLERYRALNASAVILSHNHPRGPALPSDEDIAVTRRIAALLEELGVQLLDHIVVNDYDFVSLADNGFVPVWDEGPGKGYRTKARREK